MAEQDEAQLDSWTSSIKTVQDWFKWYYRGREMPKIWIGDGAADLSHYEASDSMRTVSLESHIGQRVVLLWPMADRLANELQPDEKSKVFYHTWMSLITEYAG